MDSLLHAKMPLRVLYFHVEVVFDFLNFLSLFLAPGIKLCIYSLSMIKLTKGYSREKPLRQGSRIHQSVILA